MLFDIVLNNLTNFPIFILPQCYSNWTSPNGNEMQYQQQQQHYNHYDNYAYSQPTPEHMMYPNEHNAYNLENPTQITQVTVPVPVNNMDEADSPVLRALLSNKNVKRPSQNYSQSPSFKRQKIYISAENGTISPLRTEESVDFDFTLEKQQPINTMPLGLNGENLTASSSFPSASTTPLTSHAASSPITSYIESISTPPQSPNEAAIEHVNHMSNILDASSCSEYSQNASDGKCHIILFNIIFYLNSLTIPSGGSFSYS